MPRIGRFVATTVALCVIGLAAVPAAGFVVYTQALRLLEPADPNGAAIEITIPRGASTSNIARILKDEGLIRHATAFTVLARLRGLDGAVKAGDYLLTPVDDAETILRKLVDGQVLLLSFTVVEGLTVRDIIASLDSRGVAVEIELDAAIADPTMIPRLLTDEELELALAGEPLEGWLFPDTYRVSRDRTAQDVVRILRARTDEIMSGFSDRLTELGFTAQQALTLASIIEREAQISEERPIISGVFHNRLSLGMRLEADPTVKYVLAGTAEILTYEDIKFDSPYNTYLYAGLPPGPICNPGLDSIRAALYPADTEYLYFVASNDGAHIFSRTYDEHLAAKRRVQGR